MTQDMKWKVFLSDNACYADLINGIIFDGRGLISKDCLRDKDSQTSFSKVRDSVRKVAFGVNFAVIGIEEQETIDYSMPLRTMIYDVGEYEKQAAQIRREVKKNPEGLSSGEYLYGFKKDSCLYPTLTLILYAGAREWDGAKSLHGILNFTDIPEKLKEKVQDYKINLIEIRKFQNTGVFKTDVRQVFDFIRCSCDKNALMDLVQKDSYYQNMEEDAFDVVAYYTDSGELITIKDYFKKEDKINMCGAIKELMADSREEGRVEGAISICRDLKLPDSIILQKIRDKFQLSEDEAKRYLKS